MAVRLRANIRQTFFAAEEFDIYQIKRELKCLKIKNSQQKF